ERLGSGSFSDCCSTSAFMAPVSPAIGHVSVVFGRRASNGRSECRARRGRRGVAEDSGTHPAGWSSIKSKMGGEERRSNIPNDPVTSPSQWEPQGRYHMLRLSARVIALILGVTGSICALIINIVYSTGRHVNNIVFNGDATSHGFIGLLLVLIGLV